MRARFRSPLLGFLAAGVLQAAVPVVVVDASDFFHEIPRGDTIADSASLRVPWLFNNTALVLRSPEDAVARVTVATPGRYRLFVHSQGAAPASFKIALNGHASATTFGGAPLSWEPGGEFNLAKGPLEIRLTAVAPAPVFDCLVLTTAPALDEAALKPLQFHPEVELLKDYTIPAASAVKFGDVSGDGKTDFLVLTRDYSAAVFDHAGRELWRWQAPEKDARLRGEFEAPGSVWDFDRDGFAEVVHWRIENGQEWLVMADGRSGAVRRRVPWPTRPLPHVYNNFRTAIARLRPGYPDSLIVFTDCGDLMNITAFGPDLQKLWQHSEDRKKDHLGHYPYPIDVSGDGIDEVFLSHLALDAGGKVLWNRFDVFPDNHDHVDDFQFADLDGDGQLEAIGATSDIGVVVFRARSGEILWQDLAHHTQQIQYGRFLRQQPGLQIAAGARIYGDRRKGEPYLSGQVYWFDARGRRLSIWPANPLNGNPDFVKGDWRGRGRDELFWYKFRLDDSGRGALYFPEPVYHMFDFLANGAEQVVTLQGDKLRVYGCRGAANPTRARRDAEYLRHHVANHSHY